jgi:lipoic acid synthetase
MSGPLVRSSYRAGRLYRQAIAAREPHREPVAAPDREPGHQPGREPVATPG